MLEVERFAYTPRGTFSRVYFNGKFLCYAIEREWASNRPRVSCIPEGEYMVSPYRSPKFGESLIVEGGTVGKFPAPGYARSGILFHPANRAIELQGCIAPGMDLGVVDGQWAVTRSRAAMGRLLSMVTHTMPLRITFANDGQQAAAA